jgi:adenine deaminase
MMRVRPVTEEAFRRLVRTAKRQAPASMWLKGGNVLNVYTKEWQQVHIVTSGERIAYVGEKEPVVDEGTDILDAEGYYLVPGYIEPHAHPFQWYNPATLADFALQTGTTTMISDTLFLNSLLPPEEVADIMEKLQAHPVKQFFWARLDPQIRGQAEDPAYSRQGVAQMVANPLVIQGGELTDWQGVLTEDETILFGLKYVRDVGKRMEGHHPGASVETLNIAAAAGITACHESITAEEVINRLRLGMYATLRHSSIRPDLPELVSGLVQRGVPWSSRMMLTSDGSTPPMMRHGFTDYILRVAMESGMPPLEAYVMATLNPAVYYGLDGEIGGIAPGRVADVLFLTSPEEPTPKLVIANGRRAAREGQLLEPTVELNWSAYGFPQVNHMLDGPVNPQWFRIPHEGKAVPVLEMTNAVITKLKWEELPADEEGYVTVEQDPELSFLFCLDPRQKRLTQAVVRGFGQMIEGMASTYTASADWLIIGRDPKAMTRALERVIRNGGGIALAEQGGISIEIPLPLAGKLTDRPMGEIIAKAEEFVEQMRQKGHRHLDPIYSLLFFTATHLPFVRLTGEGLYDVKQGTIILPSRKCDG